MEKNMKQETKKAPPRRGLKKWLVSAAIVLFVLIVAIPWVLGNTSLRDQLVAKLVDNPAVQVTTRKASVGYFSPLSIDGLEVNADRGATVVEFDRIEADKSWLSMLIQRPELGTFTFVHPSFDLVVPEDAMTGDDENNSDETSGENETALAGSELLPILTADIQNAAVKVRRSVGGQPVVDLNGIDVTFHLQRDDAGSVFVVDPVTVFDHQELTPEICDKGLQLVAPLLGNEIGANGEFSFRIDKFRLPIGGDNLEDEARRVEIEGAVQLHRAQISLKDTVTGRVVEMTTKLLGEVLPDALTVANDSEVKFHLVDGQVHHEGFALMLPFRNSNVQLKSSGLVSLDGELDIILAMELPASHLGDSEFAKMFIKDPIQVSIKGNVEDPQVEFIDNQGWPDRLVGLFGGEDSGETDGDDPQAESDANNQQGSAGDVEMAADAALEIAERLGGLLKQRRENAREADAGKNEASEKERERLLPGLRDRFKGRRERRSKDN